MYVCMYGIARVLKEETKQRKNYYPRRKVWQHSALKIEGSTRKIQLKSHPEAANERVRGKGGGDRILATAPSVRPPPSSPFYSLAFLPFTPALSLSADVICPADVVTCEIPRLIPTLLCCPSPTRLPWTQGS